MSEKSIWIVITKVWGRFTGHTLADTSARTGRYCDAGHSMDPNWETCPTCDAEKRKLEKTAFEQADVKPNESIERRPTMARNPTMTPSDIPQPGRGPTKVETSVDIAPSMRRAVQRRKITGVLVTFSWQPQGRLFEIYEGRNVIGKGSVESEGGRDCDVLILEDHMLSNEHAVILCRAGRYELFDRQSTNGTFMDDKFVESKGEELRDGAKIKTGATVWLFRRIEGGAPAAAMDESVDSVDDREPTPSRPHGETFVP